MNPITDKISETPLSYVPDADLPLQGGVEDWELIYHPVLKQSYFDIGEMIDVTSLGGDVETPPEFSIKAKHVMAAAYLRIVCRISGKVFKLAFKASDTELLAFDNNTVTTYIRTHPSAIVVKYTRVYKYGTSPTVDGEEPGTLCIHGENLVIPIEFAIVDLVDNTTSAVLKRLVGPALHESI